MASREQVTRLLKLGYQGDVSIEPFAPRLQELSLPDLMEAVRAAVSYLSAAG
jgi:predicted xylose isomerase-like sugar epimerase